MRGIRHEASEALACAASTLDELPDFPVRYEHMTAREQQIADIATTLAGSMRYIRRLLEEELSVDEKPTWMNTLRCLKWHGHIDRIMHAAEGVGYPFFVWNDRIYRTADGHDTGLVVKDTEIVPGEAE